MNIVFMELCLLCILEASLLLEILPGAIRDSRLSLADYIVFLFYVELSVFPARKANCWGASCWELEI